MNIYAIIDIGSNSLKMLIYRAINGGMEIISDRATITGLGAGVYQTGNLSEKSIVKTIRVFKEYIAKAQALGVEAVTAIGTMALREAANGGEFLVRAERETGHKIEVISGEEEARLSYKAALSLPGLENKKVLIFDLGGGSTEFIYVRDKELVERKSLNIGVVNMTEQFLSNDPVTKNQIDELDKYLKNRLATEIVNKEIDIIVGVGGSVSTMSAVQMELKEYKPGLIHNFHLSREEILRQIELYRSREIERRKEIAGLQAGREEVILAGSVIVKVILSYFNQKEVIVSEQGLRHGIASEQCEKILEEQR
ncbi:MAG: Ppx/GppA family phosphatase [Candidatus Cloacimonetes bacterium]|nr:Ppx/GppA family phosphatase [Candidatus Cloacimonadota bacterium]